MNSPINPRSQPILARPVPCDERPQILPRHFGRYMMSVENAIYSFMRKLCPAYNGGYWHFYELSNAGFYMAPDSENRFDVYVDGNGFDGTLSADAAGITACLFAFSHLSFAIDHDTIPRHYHWLRDFAMDHAEARYILAAID